MLDYDVSDMGFTRNFKRIRVAMAIIGFIDITACRIHQSKKGFHMRLTVESKVPLEPIHECFLQLLFNSDYKRESFNFLRICSGIKEDWNVLFAQKFKYENGKKVMLSEEMERKDLEKVFWDAMGKKER
jgi:hypothetical protein